jgi:uncharacterized protein YfeS
MNFRSVLLSLSCSLCITLLNGQAKPSKPDPTVDFEFSLESAHPKARVLMKDDFFWDPLEETGPFGSDDGSDAAFGFIDWRIQNRSASPVKYLNELIKSWKYPFFDYTEMDTARIKDYIRSKGNLDEATIQERLQKLKEAIRNSPDTSMKKLNDKQLRETIIASSKEMGGIYLLGLDNAIIGTGFAQFVLEGKVDNDIKKLTIIAINRQLLPMLINRYEESYRPKRKQQLEKMLDVINKTN